MAAKVKVTLYFSEDLVEQAQSEAARQDRSISWLVQQAWRIAYQKLQDYPSIEALTPVLEQKG